MGAHERGEEIKDNYWKQKRKEQKRKEKKNGSLLIIGLDWDFNQ